MLVGVVIPAPGEKLSIEIVAAHIQLFGPHKSVNGEVKLALMGVIPASAGNTHLAVLHVFRVQYQTVSFRCGGDNHAIPETELMRASQSAGGAVTLKIRTHDPTPAIKSLGMSRLQSG